MTERIKYYLDGLFSTVPTIADAIELKIKLYERMSQQYQTYLEQGMGEQTAYERVIESIGDLRTLISQIQQGNEKELANSQKLSWFSPDRTTGKINDLVRNISDVTTGLISGIFSKNDPEGVRLVNQISLPLKEIEKVKISYLAESITLKQSLDGALLVKEYMNRDEPEFYADVVQGNEQIHIRHGRRKGITLRSRVEVFIPEDWHGDLTVSNISCDIMSQCDWTLASFNAKSVSGSIDLKTITADKINLFSSLGTLGLKQCTGEVDLNTSNGNIYVKEVIGGGNFSSLSGRIKVYFKELNSAVRISSETGDVQLHLPLDPNFELDAVSATGAIDSSFTKLTSHPLQNKVHGFVGHPPYQDIHISTTTGDIRVEN
ncbi:MAG: DUF4097 family beta strand repeat protein [Anaerolineaceae bacterium]|nr:DUF4097 family beta strand repeat protein [Anaerolineaceae bacterium]